MTTLKTMEDIQLNILKFLEKLDTWNLNHFTISILFKKLYTDETMCKNLNELIENYNNMNWLSLNDKCDMIMVDVHNNITNLTINFADGNSLNCLKEILILKVPYFADYQFENKLELTTDFKTTNTLIKLLYNPYDTSIITHHNFIELFKLMELWNTEKFFSIMIQQISSSKKLNILIRNQYEVNNVENLILLQKILGKIAEKYNDMKKDVNIILNKIIKIVGKNETLIVHLQNDVQMLCPKEIFKKVPYFNMMFDDCPSENGEIQLPIDVEIAKPFIKMLYSGDLDIVTSKNCIELFKLIDSFLMIDYFDIIFKFLENTEHIKTIIDFELNKNGCENLNILYSLLKNIEDETITDIVTKGRKTMAGQILSNMKIIINTLGDIGEILLKFVNWQQIFTDKQKIGAIKVSKNYELLNISNISPEIIIGFLIELDFTSNIYFDIGNKIITYDQNVHFKPNNYHFVPTKYVNVITVFNNYFPIFECLIFSVIPLNIINIIKNKITFTFNNTDIKILVDSELILGSVICEDKTIDRYKVTEINKICNENKCSTDYAMFCDPKLGKISYELILDVDVSKDRNIFSSVWLVTTFNHKVLF